MTKKKQTEDDFVVVRPEPTYAPPRPPADLWTVWEAYQTASSAVARCMDRYTQALGADDLSPRVTAAMGEDLLAALGRQQAASEAIAEHVIGDVINQGVAARQIAKLLNISTAKAQRMARAPKWTADEFERSQQPQREKLL